MRSIAGRFTERMSRTSREKGVRTEGLILLGILGLIGLGLVVSGLFSILEVSKLLGLILLVLGVATYIMFIFIERKLKLL